MADANLSGLDWFKKNQSKYPNSDNVNDLAGSFKTGVIAFIKALKDAGAAVDVSSTLRDPTRAFIMHYAWMLAKGQIKAAKIPKRAGLNIEWEHDDEKESQAAAQEMIGNSGFKMKEMAALDSNHLTGQAIDMDVSWSGTLKIKNAKGDAVEIASTPTNGGNKDLHAVGESYGVKKLLSDPPHWSFDGH